MLPSCTSNWVVYVSHVALASIMARVEFSMLSRMKLTPPTMTSRIRNPAAVWATLAAAPAKLFNADCPRWSPRSRSRVSAPITAISCAI